MFVGHGTNLARFADDGEAVLRVVAAIADALRLDAEDRLHLHHQVALSQGTELVRYAFADSRARDAVADWAVLADAPVTWLHLHSGPDTGAAVDELSATLGAEFTSRWESRPTGTPDPGLRAVVHPEVGLVRMAPQVLLAGDGLTLVVLLPEDDVAQAALDRLVGMLPGGLRRVSL